MSKYPTLSVCMIVRNEAANLPRALLSVKEVADEIIVVDTGSNDGTVEIAKKHGAKVYHFDWCDDFSAARNESLRHATKDYIMWLDGDDEFELSSSKKLKKMLKNHNGMAFYFHITVLFEDRTDDCLQIRLFPRRKEIKFEGRVHEQPNFSIKRLGIPTPATDLRITHHGYKKTDDIPQKLQRNLEILEAELAEKPDNIIIKFFLARTSMGLYRLDESVSLHKEIIEAAEKDELFRNTEYWRISYLDLTNMLATKGEYQDAKTYIRRYIDLFGADFFARCSLGNILMQEEDYAGALKEFLDAKEANLNVGTFPVNKQQMFGRLHAFAGFCMAKEGKSFEAKEHIEQAIKECGNDEEILDSVSNTYIVLKDKENLSATLLKMTPNTGKYHYKSGMCRIYEGNMPDAVSELEKALNLGFRSRNCLSALMLCCEETGEFDRAIAVGEELASFFHDDREFSKRLLALYIKTSRYDEASELLTGLNGSKDIETMAAAVYLSTLKKDWEKMLACFVALHTSVFPGIELSLERIVRLEEALIQKGEHRAARHIQKSIAAFIENSPF